MLRRPPPPPAVAMKITGSRQFLLLDLRKNMLVSAPKGSGVTPRAPISRLPRGKKAHTLDLKLVFCIVKVNIEQAEVGKTAQPLNGVRG